MTLIACKECSAPISTSAAACPQCGAPTPGHAHTVQVKRGMGCGSAIAIIFIVCAIGAIGIVLSPSHDEPTPTPAARDGLADSAAADAKVAELAEQRRQELAFAGKRDEVLAAMRKASAAKNWQGVRATGEPYAKVGDPEFLRMTERADHEILQQIVAEQKARKKKQGVSIGMSKQDVLDSSWGKPETVNQTHDASHDREQWVYRGSYLYFTDGVLTTIQN